MVFKKEIIHIGIGEQDEYDTVFTVCGIKREIDLDSCLRHTILHITLLDENEVDDYYQRWCKRCINHHKLPLHELNHTTL